MTNFGFIGLGGRGQGMLKELISVDGVKVTAVCDKYDDRANLGAEIVKEATGETADVYLDYKELLARDDIKGVVVCTTWITHSEIAIAAMNAGKHVAIEVGGAASVEECWQMVRKSEETGLNCMLLENCCYDNNEMSIFNMKKLGLLGEIVHLEGGYRHDLRDEICLGKENRHGRLANFIHRNGEVYPTHQLGPICKLIDVNRGNRLLYLCSMSSKAKGLNEWIKREKGEDYYLYGTDFNQGDVTTTMIKCANGETITLHHDCSLPRPYSRDYCVQSTKAIYKEGPFEDYFYHEDLSEEPHKYADFDVFKEKYEHPLWKQYRVDGLHESGHGGMDFLVLSAFAESVINDKKSPIDVYDTALWMVITALSEQSVAMGGMPVPIPDFTNGKWIEREPVVRGKYCLDEVCEEFFD
ncbi:MAG: Gfo/Idh/MocA family oxidoreductase [Clostridia bacterium]|nr:Gfo/Idh/MocA family oxidoreductase [Clostridia bacterium]